MQVASTPLSRRCSQQERTFERAASSWSSLDLARHSLLPSYKWGRKDQRDRENTTRLQESKTCPCVRRRIDVLQGAGNGLLRSTCPNFHFKLDAKIVGASGRSSSSVSIFQYVDEAVSLNQVARNVGAMAKSMPHRALFSDIRNEFLSLNGFFHSETPLSPGNSLNILDRALQYRPVSVASDEPALVRS
jgi:hypothetical protein